MRKQNNRFRRGIAIEMAIGMMFIMVALSIILLTVSKLQSGHRKNDLDDFKERVEVYQILDTICDEGIAAVEEMGYTVTQADNTYEIKDDGKTVVTLEITGGKIASWK